MNEQRWTANDVIVLLMIAGLICGVGQALLDRLDGQAGRHAVVSDEPWYGRQ